ncbi:MAG: hypothetical protein R2706_04245 [Acidimicrobiales bacterium]
MSPRATLGLVAAGRALALMRGRTYVTPQDIFDVARDVLRHRLILTYEALAKNLSSDDVLNRLLAVVPAANVTARPASTEPIRRNDPVPAPPPSPTPPPHRHHCPHRRRCRRPTPTLAPRSRHHSVILEACSAASRPLSCDP